MSPCFRRIEHISPADKGKTKGPAFAGPLKKFLGGYFNLGEALAMGLLLIVTVLGMELEDDDLSASSLLQDLGLNLGSGDIRTPDLDLSIGLAEEYFIENHLAAFGHFELLHLYFLSRFGDILLPTGFNNSEHEGYLTKSMPPMQPS